MLAGAGTLPYKPRLGQPVSNGRPPKKKVCVMKKGIHPDYHFVEIQLNDGTTYKTRTTHGTAGQKITLDIDPSTHPAWTGGQQQLMDRGGRLTRFNKKFAGFVKG
jgi:large subunit ribosomal protein L31